ncbi:hypothetical protein MUN81_08355 [Hymenobacter sp. 5317J-9]|uniref:hypothetical protein n=1 Tax=Hymenobacter sp. 5317J-9 TaxID=2932250 RepID=UPI001FD68A25|nr:hypothetical protein [Hymenobacter sp. 5317J-9]UOQ99489.1 hypothetical protein MUN81_08355 [Hymenobacter sp. 5317J-9]
MSMLVDVRKFGPETMPEELVEASKITKKWLRTTDNFDQYLNARTHQLPNDLNATLLADFFAFIIDELNYQEILHQYSAKLSENRKSFVVLLVAADRDWLLRQVARPDFLARFTAFLADLNGEYYDYQSAEIEEAIAGFAAMLRRVDAQSGLVVRIG